MERMISNKNVNCKAQNLESLKGLLASTHMTLGITLPMQECSSFYCISYRVYYISVLHTSYCSSVVFFSRFIIWNRSCLEDIWRRGGVGRWQWAHTWAVGRGSGETGQLGQYSWFRYFRYLSQRPQDLKKKQPQTQLSFMQQLWKTLRTWIPFSPRPQVGLILSLQVQIINMSKNQRLWSLEFFEPHFVVWTQVSQVRGVRCGIPINGITPSVGKRLQRSSCSQSMGQERLG